MQYRGMANTSASFVDLSDNALLSEVKLSAKRVAWNAEPIGPWRDEIKTLRNGWKKFEQQTPVVVMEPDQAGLWSGLISSPKPDTAVRLLYSTALGLSYA